MDKQFLPVLLTVLAILLILLFRPSPLINDKNSKCPYCLKPWWVAIVVLIVGSITYITVNKDNKPLLEIN